MNSVVTFSHAHNRRHLGACGLGSGLVIIYVGFKMAAIVGLVEVQKFITMYRTKSFGRQEQ